MKKLIAKLTKVVHGISETKKTRGDRLVCLS